MLHVFEVALACAAAAFFSQAAPTTKAPRCATCSASEALPCGVTNSRRLLKKVQSYIQSSSENETEVFANLATKPDFRIDTGFYVFVYDSNGTCVSHGETRELEGMNLTAILKFTQNVDADGEQLHKAFVRAATESSEGGWVSYQWKNSATDLAYHKIANLIEISRFGKQFYAGVGYSKIQWPPASPCSADRSGDCAETNVMSIMGEVTSALLTAETALALEAVWTSITNKVSFRLDSGFYVFAYKFSGHCVAHAANSNFVGLTLSEVLASVSNTFVDAASLHAQFISAANDGGGWVAYSWKNAASEGTYSKIAYVMKVSLFNEDYYFGVGYNNICGSSPLTSCPEDARPSCLPSEALPYQHKANCQKCDAAAASPCSIQNTISLLSRVQGQLSDFDEVMHVDEFSENFGFYVFIFDFNGTCVAHGANEKFVGKSVKQMMNMVGNTLVDGEKLHDDFVAAANRGGGWVSYPWKNKPGDDHQKVVYIIKLAKGGKMYYAGVGYSAQPTAAATTCNDRQAAPCAEANCLSIVGKAASDMYAHSVGAQTAFDSIVEAITNPPKEEDAVKSTYKIDPNFYLFMYEFDGPCAAHGANSNLVGKTLSKILSDVGNSYVDGAALHKKFVDAANKGGGWVNYEWRNNADGPFYHKSAFVMKVSAYGKDYYLGSGYDNICGDSSADMEVCSSAPPKCGAEAYSPFKVLRVGGPMQMTGKFAQYGNSAIKAFEMWRDWVNGQTNLPYSVTLDFRDDSGISTKSASIAKQMVQEDALDVVVAPYSDAASLKVVGAVAGAKPVLAWGAASEDVFRTGWNAKVFGTLTPSRHYMVTALDSLYNAGARNVLFVRNMKSFSSSVCEGGVAHAKSTGWTIRNSGDAMVVANDASDVYDQLMYLSKTDSHNLDIIVACGQLVDSIELVVQAHSSLRPKAILGTQVGTAEFLEGMKSHGISTCGFLMPTQWVPEVKGIDPVVGWSSQSFAEAFVSLTGSPPSYHTASAAASAVALSNAIQAAGGATDMDKVVQSMHSMDVDSFFGKLKFDATGKNIGKGLYTLQNQRSGDAVLVAPAAAAKATLAYPETCPAPTTAAAEEELEGWVIPMVVVVASVVILLLSCVLSVIVVKRVRFLHQCIAELRAAGVAVKRPSISDRLAVAIGRPSAREMSRSLSSQVASEATAAQGKGGGPSARRDLIGKLFDVFDRDADARLNQMELRCFVDRRGFAGSEDQWSEWYRKACSQVLAEGLVGFNKDQFFKLTADIDYAELKNMLLDLESVRSTELPEGDFSPDSFSAEADSDAAGAAAALYGTASHPDPAASNSYAEELAAVARDMRLSVEAGKLLTPAEEVRLATAERIASGIGIVKL